MNRKYPELENLTPKQLRTPTTYIDRGNFNIMTIGDLTKNQLQVLLYKSFKELKSIDKTTLRIRKLIVELAKQLT